MKRLTRTGITALICAAIGTVFYLSPAYADKVASSEIADGYMGATAIRLYDQGGMETEVSAVEGNKVSGGSFADAVLTREGSTASFNMPSDGLISGIGSKGTASGSDVLDYLGQKSGIDYRSTKLTDTAASDAAATSLGYDIQKDGYSITIPMTTRVTGGGLGTDSESVDTSVTIIKQEGKDPVITGNGLDNFSIKKPLFGDGTSYLAVKMSDGTTIEVPITDSMEDTDKAIKNSGILNQQTRVEQKLPNGAESIITEYLIGGTTQSQENHKYVLTKSGEDVVKSLLGTSDLSLSDEALYDQYKYYFDEAVQGNVSELTNCLANGASAPSNMTPVKLQDASGKWVQYYIDEGRIDMNKSFNVVSADGKSVNSISTREIIGWFNNDHDTQAACEADFSGGATIAPAQNTPESISPVKTENEAEDVDCWNSAGALGWILCPVIEFVQHTITSVYDTIVSDQLEVKSGFFSLNGDGAEVYKAWQTFQSFANIMFVIVLLAAILSQLTGIGIDNLGLKRILPKLIIAALLINLSYFICMLFVDISNLAGAGFKEMFSKMAESVASNIETTGVSGVTEDSSILAKVMLTAVGGSVAYLAVSTGTLIGITGSFIIIPLVMGLITALAGVLVFFVILGVRQAAVVILVAVSPVAFAAYMLPNTKWLFDKWVNMLKAMLMLYPICGLLMGGSAFASAILLTLNTGFLGNLIAMLVAVVPFFLIPKITQGSLSAMGNLGAKISGIGMGLGRRAAGAAGKSQGLNELRDRLAAGRKADGSLTWAGRRREATARGETLASKIPGIRRRVAMSNARAQMNYQKRQDELDFASRPELIESEAKAKRFKRRQDAAYSRYVNSGVSNRTGDLKDFDPATSVFTDGTQTAALMAAARNGNVEDIYALTNMALASGHHGAEGLRQAIRALEHEGNSSAIENIAKAAKDSRDLGDLKSGARSTYDYLTAVADGGYSGQSVEDFTGKTKFSNMSEAQLFNTDNEELRRYADMINTKRQSGEAFTSEEQTLISQANAAYNNERLRGNAKESRQDLVADIAGISSSSSGTSGGTQTGETLEVDHSNAGGGTNGKAGKGVNSDGVPTSETLAQIGQAHGNHGSGGSGGGGTNGGNSGNQSSGTPRVNTMATMKKIAASQSTDSSRGNMSDADLQKVLGHMEQKVNVGTASLADQEIINTIHQEQGRRQNLRNAQSAQNTGGSRNNQPRPPMPPNRPNRKV